MPPIRYRPTWSASSNDDDRCDELWRVNCKPASAPFAASGVPVMVLDSVALLGPRGQLDNPEEPTNEPTLNGLRVGDA
ncbi:flagellar protein FlgA [Anopheles sinensis]|uniref:Flagellar protein FlgA n=1 Tax=Anopheles sinensis TaxID=74873 RepID=A0A084WGH3_ANOSI|nr:flagellar protein FlgA [Anopheles sinensis]